MSNIFEATGHAFHTHPALCWGSLAGVVLLGFVLTRGGSGGGGGTTVMQYSIGPSDAAVQAGAAIQMAQIGANATTAQTVAAVNGQVDIAGINANVATKALDTGLSTAALSAGVAKSQQEYGYLTTLSNNTTGAHISDNETELGTIQSNNSANVQIQQSNNSTWLQGQQASNSHDEAVRVIAVNAALAGSQQYQLLEANNTWRDEITNAVNNGASVDTLNQLRASMEIAVNAANASVTSADWQAFHG